MRSWEYDLFGLVLFPCVHTKAIIVAGEREFISSVNLTGSRFAAKHPNVRNFEAGIFTTEQNQNSPLVEWFDELFIGGHFRR